MRFVLALAALSLVGCVDVDFGPSDRYQTDFHYTWELQPGGHVNVESFNGSVEIAGWDDNKVEVRGVKYGSTEALRDAIRIETQNAPSSIELRAVHPSTRFGGSGARFTIHVPKTAILDRVVSSNGSLRVTGVAGAAHLKTSNSSIRAENLRGDLDARTSNGSIDVDGIEGALTLRTSNSRIHATGLQGPCDASTSNGGIELEYAKAPRTDLTAHTSNSGITVRLPAGTNAQVDAQTSNSSVSCDFDLVGSRDENKRRAEGRIGSGGPLLRLSTSNGHIHIARSGVASE